MHEPGESRKARGYTSGDPEIDRKLREILDDCESADEDLMFEMLATVMRMARDPVSRYDRKLANSALKEIRYAFRVFSAYRDVRKVSIFGSARTEKGDPEYEVAKQFSKLIADAGWMVVTGAGPGIMEAGHEGAGGSRSFGVNIRLPFEAEPNPVIAGDPKLINFKYFFTRKLMFMKEADAFVLLPGGFGTLDETFELLTLVQTGKSDIHPIVLLEPAGGTYWKSFETYLREELLNRGMIDKSDLNLYRCFEKPEDAVTEIEKFYRVYHSQRYVARTLIIRMNMEPSAETLARLSEEFSDSLTGPLKIVPASKVEIREKDYPDLPRIAVEFHRLHAGRLRLLIDHLNESAI